VNILNKQLQTSNKGWSSSLGLGEEANNSSPHKKTRYKMEKVKI